MQNQILNYNPNLLTGSEFAANVSKSFNLDSTSALFFENEITATLPGVVAQLYQKLQLTKYINFKSSAVPGQSFVEFYRSDAAGKPIFVSDGSTEMSFVDLTRSKERYELFQTKIDIAFSKSELDQARLAGISLIEDKYDTAIRSHAQQTEDFGWLGNGTPKIQGWLTNPYVPNTPVAPGDSGQTTWKSKTPQEIIYDIGKAIDEYILQGGDNHVPDTLLLSLQNYSYLNTTLIPGSPVYTLLNFIKGNFANLKIDWAFKFDKAFAGGTDGFILYENNPKHFWYEWSGPMWSDLRDKEFSDYDKRTAMYMTHGGVIIQRPNAHLFKYGI